MRMFRWENLRLRSVSGAEILKSVVNEKLRDGYSVELVVFHHTFLAPDGKKGPPGLAYTNQMPDGSWFSQYNYQGDIDDPWDVHLAGLVFSERAENERGSSDFLYRFFQEDRKYIGTVPDYGELMIVRLNHAGIIVYNEQETHEYFSAGFPPDAIWKVVASEKLFTDNRIGVRGEFAPSEVVEQFLEECRKAREISGIAERLKGITYT